jgi:nucleoside-diphosphate-sugar epimerase
VVQENEDRMFFSGKRVLVTGGSGFVGTHFVQALLEQDARIRVPIHQRSMITIRASN